MEPDTGRHESRWWNVRQWRIRTSRPSLPVVLMLCAVAAALATAGTLWLKVDRDDQAAQADVATTVATNQATTLDRLCATDPDVARRIPDDCREARQIREEVVAPTAAPGPSQAQVQGWVDTWLEDHPPRDGKSVTPAMVARAVAEHMAGNGAEQITRVAQAYIAAHAEKFRGLPGLNATDEQVATQVAAFCAEHGDCQGPEGEKGDKGEKGDTGEGGPQGIGVVDIHPDRDDQGACVWVVVFENPATGEQRTATHPAGEAACPAAPPPEETSGGLLPGG